jgi:hypothetical protein
MEQRVLAVGKKWTDLLQEIQEMNGGRMERYDKGPLGVRGEFKSERQNVNYC